MKYIFLFIGIISLYSCNRGGYIALSDAEKGMFLDRASTKSVNTFFYRRMEGDLNSNNKKEWIIVNEDLDYIYFGLLVNQNGFNVVNPFYKVNREQLNKEFPGFRNIKGGHVKAKVFQTFIKPILDERLVSICPDSYNVDYSKKQYELTKDGIESVVEFTGRCYEDKIFKAKVNVLLDPSNIDVLDSNIKYY